LAEEGADEKGALKSCCSPRAFSPILYTTLDLHPVAILASLLRKYDPDNTQQDHVPVPG
jgi:hypothetical protein